MRYVYQGWKQGEVVASTCLSPEREDATKEMQDAIEQRPEIKRPFMHATISVEPSEPLSAEQWQEVAHRYMAHMGYEACPYIAIQHHDTDHHHIHIVSSRVGMDAQVVSTSFDYRKAELFARKMELELGLKELACSWEQDRKAPAQREYHQELRLDKASARSMIEQALTTVQTERKVTQWVEGLDKLGVEVKPRLSSDKERVIGVSFSYEGVHIAGSHVNKSASWNRLQSRFDDDAECDLILWSKLEQARRERTPEQAIRHTKEVVLPSLEKAGEALKPSVGEQTQDAQAQPSREPKRALDQAADASLKTPFETAQAPTTDELKAPSSVRSNLNAFEREQLHRLLIKADWSHGYQAWQDSLKAQGIEAIPRVSASDRSQVRGIYFEYQGQLIPGSKVGKPYSFEGIQKQLGLYDGVKDAKAFAQMEVAGIGRIKASPELPQAGPKSEPRLCDQARPISMHPVLKRFETLDVERPVFEAKAGDELMSLAQLSALYQQQQQVWLRADGVKGEGTLIGQDVMLKEGRHSLIVDVQHRVVLVPYQESFEALRGQDVMLERGALMELKAYQAQQVELAQAPSLPPIKGAVEAPPRERQEVLANAQAQPRLQPKVGLEQEPKSPEVYPVRPVSVAASRELDDVSGARLRTPQGPDVESKAGRTEAVKESSSSTIAPQPVTPSTPEKAPQGPPQGTQTPPSYPVRPAQEDVFERRICERSKSLKSDQFLHTLGQDQGVYPLKRGDKLASIEELLAHRQSIQKAWTPLEKAPEQPPELSVMPRPIEAKEGRFAVLVTQEHRVYFAPIPRGFEGALGRDLQPQDLKHWARSIEREKALQPAPMPQPQGAHVKDLERDQVSPVREHRTLRHFAQAPQEGERSAVQARDPQTKALLETKDLIEQQRAAGESWRVLKSDQLPERATLMEKDIVTAQGRHSLAVTQSHEVILMKHYPSHDKLKGQDISFIANDQNQVRIVAAPEREQTQSVSLEQQAQAQVRQAQLAQSTRQAEPEHARKTPAFEQQKELPSLQQWKAQVKADTRKDVNIVYPDKSVRGVLLNDDLHAKEGRFALVELPTKHIALVPYQPELEAHRHREVAITRRAGTTLEIKDMTPKLSRDRDR